MIPRMFWMAVWMCLTLGLGVPSALRAAIDASSIESKVTTDLELALSRIVPDHRFIVQVTADVATQAQKRLVEGETIVDGPEEGPPEKKVEIMPGFVPEPHFSTPTVSPKKAIKNREVFRIVETQSLQSVRVHVALDETLPPETHVQSRTLVQNYLGSAYPTKSLLTFSRIPLLKPSVDAKKEADKMREELVALDKKAKDAERALAAEKEKKEEKEPTWEDKLREWSPYLLIALSAVVLYLLIANRKQTQTPYAPFYPPYPPYDPRSHGRSKAKSRSGKRSDEVSVERGSQAISASEASTPEPDEEALFAEQRRKFLRTILGRSEAYKLYYSKLSAEGRQEIYGALKGPAYEKFLEGLGLPIPSGDFVSSDDMGERLHYHEEAFEEFTHAKDWQDRQFFGFLGRLSDEQLVALVNHVSPLAVCIMLRFMKPTQSAFILDSIPKQKRVEVLSHLSTLQTTSFSEMVSVEREVRAEVDRLPQHLFGSPREDLDFWGAVLTESQDQDQIIEDLEHTQPGIAPTLSKFKFKLDDLARIPAKVFKKIMSEVDNEELGLALTTCAPATIDYVLKNVSPSRREVLQDQIATFRGAPKKQAVDARLVLTKRFREALA